MPACVLRSVAWSPADLRPTRVAVGYHQRALRHHAKEQLQRLSVCLRATLFVCNESLHLSASDHSINNVNNNDDNVTMLVSHALSLHGACNGIPTM